MNDQIEKRKTGWLDSVCIVLMASSSSPVSTEKKLESPNKVSLQVVRQKRNHMILTANSYAHVTTRQWEYRHVARTA